MPFSEISLGSLKDAVGREARKAAVAEFISVLLFVFAGQGSGMALRKVRKNMPAAAADVVAIALAHCFGLAAGVSAGKNVSGGHVNPAVTFGAFVGGNIPLVKMILYWIAQLFGSTIACLLLKLATHGQHVIPFKLGEGVNVGNTFLLELVTTFGLVYIVYLTAIDRRRGSNDTIAPIVIGLIVGANILAGGASMNPALAFGPAIVSSTWKHHWVYWLGPLAGGGLAGVVFASVMDGGTDSPSSLD